MQHRTSFPKALDGDRCRDSRPEGPPVTPSPPPHALAAVPQKAWLARPRGQSRGGRAGWTVSVPSARQGSGGGSPGAGQGQRGLFGCKVPSGGAGHGQHAGGSAQARGRVRAQTSCPKKVTWEGGGGRKERGEEKKKKRKKSKGKSCSLLPCQFSVCCHSAAEFSFKLS